MGWLLRFARKMDRSSTINAFVFFLDLLFAGGVVMVNYQNSSSYCCNLAVENFRRTSTSIATNKKIEVGKIPL